MKKVIRAWKDPVYRASLSAAEQADLVNPAGMIELDGTDLEQVAGGGSGKSGGSSKSSKSSKSGKSGSGGSGSGKSGGSGSGKSGGSGSGKC